MLPSMKLPLILGVAAFLCPLSGAWGKAASARDVTVATQAPDTTIVRLHIFSVTILADTKTPRRPGDD
jgi:hypothetical protein